MMAAAITYEGQGVLRHDEPLHKHTSWRVGGTAQWYFKPDSLDELCNFLADLPQEIQVTWLGLGSNVLIRDGGIAGVVIATHGVLSDLEQEDDGTLYVEAGVACAKVARHCVRQGFGDAHFFAGIPGTLGGALAMNAGAFGGETWSYVQKARMVSRQGELSTHDAKSFAVAYRQVRTPVEGWFVGAWLKFEKQDAVDPEQIRDLLIKRKQTQPIGQPSCGSVFRNPTNDFAARLIQAAGLKGYSMGGAQVSDMHANFIINTGDATAADIESLIDYIQQEVRRQFGVHLQPEVKIIGEALS